MARRYTQSKGEAAQAAHRYEQQRVAKLLTDLHDHGAVIVRSRLDPIALRLIDLSKPVPPALVERCRAMKAALAAWLADRYPHHYDFNEPAEHTRLHQRAAVMFAARAI